MNKKTVLLILCFAVLIVFVGCGSSQTTTLPVAEQTDPEYYYQTVDNFFEIESDERGQSELFRYDANCFKEVKSPTVEVVADIPSTVVLDGVSYELTDTPIEINGRDLRYGIKNGVPFSEDVPSYVVYDAVNGKMNGIFHMAFQTLTAEQESMEWEALAKLLIATYLPHVDLTDYVVIQNSDPDTSKGYDFPHLFKMQALIDGYLTDRFIQVFVYKNQVFDVLSLNTYNYEELDLTLLEYLDHEEHQRIIDSYIDYIKDGRIIEISEIRSKWIVWTEDGRYAVRYDVRIHIKNDRINHGIIKLCIVLDSDAE